MKTKRQEASSRRRQLLLETAVETFLELGYQQTGVREIARRAGTSLGNLYNHFSGKEAVLVEIARIESIEITRFIDGLSTNADVLKRLKSFVEKYLKYSAQRENVLLGIEIYSEAVRNPTIAEVFDDSRNKLIKAVAKNLNELHKQNQTVTSNDAADKARLVVDLLEAQARHTVFTDQKVTRRDVNLVWKMMRFEEN